MLSIITELTQFAPTQSNILNFNSYGQLGNKYLAANENGIYSLCECNDAAGADINGYFIIHRTDFGIPNPKTLRSLFIGYEANGSIKLTVTVDQTFTRAFLMPAVYSSNEQHGNRVSISRELKGRYFEFKIEGMQGADFAFDRIDATIIKHPFKPRGAQLAPPSVYASSTYHEHTADSVTVEELVFLPIPPP